MKRRGMLALLSSTVAVSFMATVISTLAWFNTTINISPEENLNGFSDGAYFAGGDGLTPETAYIIRTPRHLYNLAWLQYLGYFNEDKKNNTTGAAGADGIIDQQYYFILDNDLDMNPGDSAKTQWTIPPIGTQKYPFVGTFIGNNKTITDLRISNFFNDYNKTPSVIKTSSDIKDVNIVGFFGVVGTISASGNSINKSDTGVNTYTYSTSAVSISNVGLDNLEVKSATTTSLIGLAAGYVNGPVTGVAIKDSKITTNGGSRVSGLGTSTNLSDYSVAGFVRPAYLNTIDKVDKQYETPSVENEVVSGPGDEFGASIAMNTMYDRLYSLKTTGSSIKYTSSETKYDGVIDNSKTEENTFTVSYDSSTYKYVTNSETDSSGNKVSSYTFNDQGSNQDAYMYLYGNKTINYNKTVNDHTPMTSAPSNGAQFYIHSGSNYLGISGGTVANTTLENATLWTYNSGKLSGDSYYLAYSSGNLALTEYSGSATTWNVSYQNNEDFLISYTTGGTTYYIAYTNANWGKLKYIDNTVKYYFKYGDNYMRWGGTSGGYVYPHVYSTTDVNEATEWMINNSNQIYPVGYSSYYLGWYGIYNNEDFPLQCFSDTKAIYTYNTTTKLMGGSYRQNYTTTYYYAKYDSTKENNLNWEVSSSTNETTAKNGASQIDRVQVPVHTTDDFKIGLYQKTSSSVPTTYTSPATYFPLSYEEGTTNISARNTGYVVSGSNYTAPSGDIRVSKYSNHGTATYQSGEHMKQLTNSLNGGYLYTGNVNSKNYNLTVVTKTAKAGKYVLLSDGYNSSNTGTLATDLSTAFGSTKTSVSDAGLVKYAASRSQLHTLLNSTLTSTAQDNGKYTYLYGLHFMNAQIDPEHKITIPYASINNTTYTNYELPNDCIDFNLKNNGYVNFFAGTYFPGNTTFFSLHNIFRDGSNQITGIKEISQIYLNVGKNRKTYKYIYKYTDNTYNCNLGNGDNEGIIETDNEGHEVLQFDMSWVTNPTMVKYALYYFEIPVNKGEYALGSVSGKDGAYLIYLDIGAGVKTQDITTFTEHITTNTSTYTFVKGIEFVAVIPTTADGWTAIDGTMGANLALASCTGSTTYAFNAARTILTCGPPTAGKLTCSFASYPVIVYENSTELTPVATGSSYTDVYRTTTYSFDNDTLALTTTVTEVSNGGDPVQISQIVQENQVNYEAAEVISSAGQTILHFHYQKADGVTVTIASEYDPENDTYSITITSTGGATLIYIDSVLASYTVDGVLVEYTVKINNTVVTSQTGTMTVGS